MLYIYATRPNDWTFDQIKERYGYELTMLCDGGGRDMLNETEYDVKLDYSDQETCVYRNGKCIKFM